LGDFFFFVSKIKCRPQEEGATINITNFKGLESQVVGKRTLETGEKSETGAMNGMNPAPNTGVSVMGKES
jgi:hypothetical protein